MLRYEAMLSFVIHQLKKLGWTPWVEQNDNNLTCPKAILASAIRRLNPGITSMDMPYVIQTLTADMSVSGIDTSDIQQELLATNRFIWERLIQGIVVRRKIGQPSRRIRIIDFDAPASNTYVYQTLSAQEPFDLILWVNGLPVVWIVFEATAGSDTQCMSDYWVKNYSDPRVYCNHCVVRLGLTDAHIGTLSTPMDQYARWPAPQDNVDELPLTSLMSVLCNPAHLLDRMQYFVVFESSSKQVKKIARYHQVRAVQRCIQGLIQGQTARERGGVIWHTQGSGKSLSMLFLTRKIRQVLPGYKIVLLTDRVQLAQQLHTTFEHNHHETIQVATSTAIFQALLKTEAPNLVLGMIQKCRSEPTSCSNPSSQIIVLIDEAHRSHYGTLALTLQQWLPQAVRIAFTATPLLQSDRTRQVFGDIIDTYTLPEAIADGVTVPLTYVRREVQLSVDSDQLEKAFRTHSTDGTEQKPLQRRAFKVPIVLNARPRIQQICRDIIQHYQQQIQPQGGKALVVTRSRQAAMHYHRMLDQLSAPVSACIISARSGDPVDYAGYTDRQHQTEAIQRFRDPQHPLSLLVVHDMLLTGFDAPICQAMYLDKRMRAHGLLQAISRVNRTRPGKQQGYIVDYVGLAAKLSEALTTYATPPQNLHKTQLTDGIPALRAAHTRLQQTFGGISRSAACRTILRDPMHSAQFYPLMHRFNRAMRQVMPAQEARPYLADWRYWRTVVQPPNGQFITEPEWLAPIQEILDTVLQVRLQTKGTVSLAYLMQGMSGTPVSPLWDTVQHCACSIGTIEQTIKHYIVTHVNQEPAYFRQLSQQLDKLLNESAEDWDKLEQMLLQLRDAIAENQQTQWAEWTASEQAFYNTVLEAVQLTVIWDGKDKAQHDEIKQIARDIVAMLQQATQIVEFFYKQDEIKSIRKQIRRRLMDSTFGRADARMARRITDRCMALARVKFGT